MFGTYVSPDEYGLFERDHPAIVYPVSFKPRDEFTAEAEATLFDLARFGLDPETHPWHGPSDEVFERCVADMINAVCGFKLQARCDRMRRALAEAA